MASKAISPAGATAATITKAPGAAAPPAPTTTKAAEEPVLRLPVIELISNARRYAGKRITVNEPLMLGAESWEQHRYRLSGGPAEGDPYNPPLEGSPYNPRCEYYVWFSGAPGTIEGCVPRSKVEYLAGAWNGELVRFVATVPPDPTYGAGGLTRYVFLRDVMIVQPPEHTDEKWPDERNKR